MYKGGTVYMLSSVSRRTLYVGVTSDLQKRMFEHKNKVYPDSFTAKYNCILLVYYKHFSGIEDAIAEEKRIKVKKRLQKELVINQFNPSWNDLSETLTDWWPHQE